MIDGLIALAKWAVASGSATSWLLLLNFLAITALAGFVWRYVPRHTHSMYEWMKEMKDEHKKQGDSLVFAMTSQTRILEGLFALLNASATGQVQRPIILTLDGTGQNVEELLRRYDSMFDVLRQAMARLERIEIGFVSLNAAVTAREAGQ